MYRTARSGMLLTLKVALSSSPAVILPIQILLTLMYPTLVLSNLKMMTLMYPSRIEPSPGHINQKTNPQLQRHMTV